MRIIPKLTRGQRRRLQRRRLRERSALVKTRVVVILQLADGLSSVDIERNGLCVRSTVSHVAARYRELGELGLEDFIRSASGTFLNERGRRAFWEAWFRRMDAEVTHPEFDYKMSYRRMLEVQARQLWRFVRGEATAYHGFTTR